MSNTYYIPDQNGWSSGNYRLRLKVEQTYNSGTRKSELSVTPQFSANYSYGGYNLIAGAIKYQIGDGAVQTLWDFTQRTAGSSIPYSAPFGTEWADMVRQAGSADDWKTTETISNVSHNDAGYAYVTFTADGAQANSGNNYATFTGSFERQFTGSPQTFTLSVSTDAHSHVTVTRNGVELHNGDTFPYGSQLVVTFSADENYMVKTHTVNGYVWTSGNAYWASGNISVVATSEAAGLAYIRRSGAWAAHQCYIYHSGAWAQYRPYIYKSGAWVPYG